MESAKTQQGPLLHPLYLKWDYILSFVTIILPEGSAPLVFVLKLLFWFNFSLRHIINIILINIWNLQWDGLPQYWETNNERESIENVNPISLIVKAFQLSLYLDLAWQKWGE